MVYDPYHFRIPPAKGKQGWLEVANVFILTHVEGQDPTQHGLRGAGDKSRQSGTSEVTDFNTFSC